MSPDTPSDKIARLEERMKNVEAFLPQFVAHISKSNTFFDRHEEREETLEKVQEDRHRENRAKLEEINSKIAKKTMLVTVQGVIWTAAGVIVAILALLVTIRFATHSELINPFHSDLPAVYAGE